MISKSELDKAVEIARKYDIGKLYLVGSALHKEPDEISDYDFAVKEVPKGSFLNSMENCLGKCQS